MRLRNLALPALIAGVISFPAFAQDVGIGSALGDISSALAAPGVESGQLSGRIIQLFGLITLLSVAPGLLVVMTSFTRFVIVFSMLRSSLGLGQSPPNMVITSLALFMTMFVMQPVFEDSWEDGLAPLIAGSITEEQAVPLITAPFHHFMVANTREEDLALFASMAAREGTAEEGQRTESSGVSISGLRDLLSSADRADDILPEDRSEISWSTLVPAFMISELRRAFTIGFLISIPFFVIDLVVASVLMAAGMMMLPPVMISTIFKVIFFVLIDGWYMLVGALMQSYSGV